MLRTLIGVATASLLLTGVAVAESTDAEKAKEKACKTEMKAKNITDKSAKETFLNECMARS